MRLFHLSFVLRGRRFTSEVSVAVAHAGNVAELRAYWAEGAGAAKWTTFTQLVALLRKYITSERERNGFAARVYHQRYGRWPGH